MTNLIELLAFGGAQSDVCAQCGLIVAPDLLVSMPVTVEADVLLCEACMTPIREEYARELALCDGSSDDPLQEGFHGVDERCDHAQPIEEQIAARQPWAPEGRPVRTRRQEKEQFLAQHPEFQFPDDRQVGPILACNIPLQEVIRQVRSALACVTEPGSEHNPANARAERSYRAFLLAVEAE